MPDVADRAAAAGGTALAGALWRARPAGFRDYVHRRRYDFGRGSAAAWSFIALARGDRGLPDAKSWRELEAYLKGAGAPEAQLAAARSVWRSFTAHRSRAARDGGFR